MVTAAETTGIDALVSDNVRAARARLRLRQADLAERLGEGWSRSSVAALEDRRRRVYLADAVALCQALDVTLADLLAGADGLDARRVLGAGTSSG